LCGLALAMGWLLCACAGPKATTAQQGANAKLLRQCPEQWVINQRPRVVPEGQQAQADEYFIIGGKRVERTALDWPWVQRHCLALQPTVLK